MSASSRQKASSPCRVRPSRTVLWNSGRSWRHRTPGILGSSSSFRQDYVYPIENDHDAVTAERFKRITAPFMMRRLKTDKSIIEDLPEKVSIDEYCTLTKEQVALYNEVVKRSMRLVEASKDTFMRHSLVLQMIM